MNHLRHSSWHRSVQGVSGGMQAGEEWFTGALILWAIVLLVTCFLSMLLSNYQEDKERRVRRAYLLNHLVTKKVFIGEAKKTAEVQKFHNIILPTLNSSQHSSRQSVEEGGLEPCAICLEDYKQGDEVCWSRNRHCAHVFHQKCIVEWLLHHEGCPVCRQDYLSLENSDNAETELHESVEQTFTEETEDSLADEVHPPTGDIKDRSVDEVPRDP